MTNRVTIKLTANFERNLADIEQFLTEAQAPQAFDGLLIWPCEVLSRVANVTILEVANNALRVLLQHRHVIIGSLA